MGRLMTSPWRPHAGHGTMARLRVLWSRKTTLQARQPTRWPLSPTFGAIAVLLAQRGLREKAHTADSPARAAPPAAAMRPPQTADPRRVRLPTAPRRPRRPAPGALPTARGA